MNSSDALTDAEISDFVASLRAAAASHAPSLQVIETRLGLEPGFVLGLMNEKDDWAFIIKTAVVIEAALGQVISALLMNDALDRHIRSLPMDGRTGKTQLAQDLDLIGPMAAARIRALAEIRNDFAHGLKVVDLSISEYFVRMTKAKFESLTSRFFSTDRKAQDRDGQRKLTPKKDLSSKEPRDGRVARYLVWTCACLALLELSEAQRKIDTEARWRSALTTLGHAFLSRQQGDEATARLHMRAALDTLESVADLGRLRAKSGEPKSDA